MSPELKNLISQWNKLNFIDRFYFYKIIQLQDSINIQLGVSVGTQLGTSPLQKLALWGATPIVQPGAITAANSQGATYNQSDVQSIATAVNSIRTALKNAGITG